MLSRLIAGCRLNSLLFMLVSGGHTPLSSLQHPPRATAVSLNSECSSIVARRAMRCPEPVLV